MMMEEGDLKSNDVEVDHITMKEEGPEVLIPLEEEMEGLDLSALDKEALTQVKQGWALAVEGVHTPKVPAHTVEVLGATTITSTGVDQNRRTAKERRSNLL
jgi:hypothetical protein